jgi:hypothetical protein
MRRPPGLGSNRAPASLASRPSWPRTRKPGPPQSPAPRRRSSMRRPKRLGPYRKAPPLRGGMGRRGAADLALKRQANHISPVPGENWDVGQSSQAAERDAGRSLKRHSAKRLSAWHHRRCGGSVENEQERPQKRRAPRGVLSPGGLVKGPLAFDSVVKESDTTNVYC